MRQLGPRRTFLECLHVFNDTCQTLHFGNIQQQEFQSFLAECAQGLACWIVHCWDMRAILAQLPQVLLLGLLFKALDEAQYFSDFL